MSQFTEKQLIEEGWVETRDDQGRRKFIHPTIIRNGGRKLGVFASDVRGDDGKLQLAGKYLVPLPSLIIEDEDIKQIKKVWVTKPQAKRIIKQMGSDYRDILRADFASVLIGFAAKAAQGLLKVGAITLNPLQELIFDGAFRYLSDEAYKSVKKGADYGLENLATEVETLTSKLANEVRPLFLEVLGPDFNVEELVSKAVSPVLKEMRELFD